MVARGSAHLPTRSQPRARLADATQSRRTGQQANKLVVLTCLLLEGGANGNLDSLWNSELAAVATWADDANLSLAARTMSRYRAELVSTYPKASPQDPRGMTQDEGGSQDPVSAIRSVREALKELDQFVGKQQLPAVKLHDWILRHHAILEATERTLLAREDSQSCEGRPALFGKIATDLLQALGTVSAANRRQSLQVALGALMKVTGAGRGFIALRQHDGSFAFPVVQASLEPSQSQPELAFSQGILRAAFDGAKPILTGDACSDARFSRKKSVQELNLRAVLVVPLVAHGQPFGVLGLDNPSGNHAFAEGAQSAAEEFSRVIGPILERDLELVRVEEHRLERLARLRHEFDFGSVIGQSDALLDVLEIALRVASTDASVLITGETGTGKELIAQCIHANSLRRRGRFVPVNCSALPAELVETELFGHERGAFTGAAATRIGRFEQAHGGTIFLDEVGELSAPAQAKILRVLQDGRFDRVGASTSRHADFRLISATNRDIDTEMDSGRFRRDLGFRLNVIRLHMPPLRERDGDVALLAQHLLRQAVHAKTGRVWHIHDSAMSALEAYHWPGNVRELKNAIERAMTLSRDGEITADGLPAEVKGRKPAGNEVETLKSALREHKRLLVQRALDAARGDHQAAAQSLGVHPKYLYQLLRELAEQPHS
jgi:Nif-specific regulatory protein